MGVPPPSNPGTRVNPRAPLSSLAKGTGLLLLNQKIKNKKI